MALLVILTTVAKILFLIALCLGLVPFATWLERRGSAWMQGRVGPNRVGPFGLIQPFADAIKFFFKEDFIPRSAARGFYLAAPWLALVAPLAALISLPFGSYVVVFGYTIPLQVVQLDVGVLLVLAFAGLEIYPLILAGWASNNKYSMLGALRGTVQLISYEIAMGLALLSLFMIYGTFDLMAMVHYQSVQTWGVVLNPVAALIVWVAGFAETNRLPFDLAEGEPEIVAGYHLEYGAMKFALFFMAEYVAMMMVSGLFATLFLGGFNLLPGFALLAKWLVSWGSFIHPATALQNFTALLQFLSLFLKVAALMFVFIWVRWTFPRFRFDQLMHLGWNILLPLSLVNLMVVALLIYFEIY